jgi:CDP-glucose 4,6-dehydratase
VCNTSTVPDRWSPDRAFWLRRNVAVTGGTGFLGSHLVTRLVDLGATVTVLVRDDVPWSSLSAPWREAVSQVRGTVEDQATVERLLGEYGAETVLHLAAQTQVEVANRNPVSTFEANIRGTWALLEAARRSPTIRSLVVASSDKAYGDQTVLPYTEDMPLRAVNPYDVSKACADMLSACYNATFGLPVVITRCGNFFGPGDTNWRRLVPGTIRSLLAGEAPVIRSDGTLTRDYLYVEDGALSYLQLAEAVERDPSLGGQAFNFSTERPLSVLELVGMICDAMGVEALPEVQGLASHEIAHQYLAADKARRLLGWRPSFTVEEALHRTVAWYRQELAYPLS